MLDGLPVTHDTHSVPGFPLGVVQDKTYLHNHYEIYIQVHERSGSYRIVGAHVKPQSLRSEICVDQDPVPIQDQTITFPYTYDVYWVPSEIPWGSRWDSLLNTGNTKVHWLGVMNAMMVMFLLAAFVFMILLRAVRRDVLRYNDIEVEDMAEEVGWKLVHGDVFRPPVHRMWLSMLVGNGVQWFCMSWFTLLIACLGFLSPSNRGSLGTTLIVSYFLVSGLASYTSARIYKTCGGQHSQWNTLWTLLLVPGTLLILLLAVNVFFILRKSSWAIPFGTLFALISLWIFLSIPLGLVGAYLGFRGPVS
jgi:transmembrane 9 superfamily protein 2/4